MDLNCSLTNCNANVYDRCFTCEDGSDFCEEHSPHNVHSKLLITSVKSTAETDASLEVNSHQNNEGREETETEAETDEKSGRQMTNNCETSEEIIDVDMNEALDDSSKVDEEIQILNQVPQFLNVGKKWSEKALKEELKKEVKLDPNGKFFKCLVCVDNRKTKRGVMVTRHPFDFGRWEEHTQTESHLKLKARKVINKKQHKIAFHRVSKSSMETQNGRAQSIPQQLPKSVSKPSNSLKLSKPAPQCRGVFHNNKIQWQMEELFFKYRWSSKEDRLKFLRKSDSLLEKSDWKIPEDRSVILFAKNCTGNAVEKSDFQCQACLEMLRDRNIRATFTNMHVFRTASDVIKSKHGVVSVAEIQNAKKLISYSDVFLNDSGLLLKSELKAWLSYTEWITKHGNQLQLHQPDSFLKKFCAAYNDADNGFRKSLLVGLAKVLVFKTRSPKGIRYDAKVLDFCDILRSQNKQAYDLFCANIVGPSLRRLQQITGKHRSACLIDETFTKQRVQAYINATSQMREVIVGDRTVEKHQIEPLLCSLSFDATKLVPMKQISAAFQLIVGGVHDNTGSHMLEINDENRSRSLPLAQEVKIAVITSHNGRDDVSPMAIVAARPQSKNQNTTFNQEIEDIVKAVNGLHLVSVSTDALDWEYISKKIESFLETLDGIVPNVDTNHVLKALRNQLVSGVSIFSNGSKFLDKGLLLCCAIPKDLYEVSDYASDKLVLQFASQSTASRIIENSNPNANILLILYLATIRIFAVAVNAKEMDASKRTQYLYFTLIIFTSFTGISNITLRNLTLSILGNMFLSFSQVVLRYCSSEPCEHTFGVIRMWNREFTLENLLIFSEKTDRYFEALYKGTVRSKKSGTGYAATTPDFVAANDKKLDARKPFEAPNWNFAAEQIIVIVNNLRKDLLPLMKALGFKEISPFLNEDFVDWMHFAKVAQKYLKERVVEKVYDDENEITNSKSKNSDFGNSSLDKMVEELVRCETENSESQQEIEPNQNEKGEEEPQEALLKYASFADLLHLGERVRMQEVANTNLAVQVAPILFGIMGEKLVLDGKNCARPQKFKSFTGRWFGKRVQKTTPDNNVSLKRNDLINFDGLLYFVCATFRFSGSKWKLCSEMKMSKEFRFHAALIQINPLDSDEYILAKMEEFGERALINKLGNAKGVELRNETLQHGYR